MQIEFYVSANATFNFHWRIDLLNKKKEKHKVINHTSLIFELNTWLRTLSLAVIYAAVHVILFWEWKTSFGNHFTVEFVNSIWKISTAHLELNNKKCMDVSTVNIESKSATKSPVRLAFDIESAVKINFIYLNLQQKDGSNNFQKFIAFPIQWKKSLHSISSYILEIKIRRA